MQIVGKEMLQSGTNKPKKKFRFTHAINRGIGLVSLSMLPLSLYSQPPSSTEITPPPGNVLFLTTHAAGTQNYICLPSRDGNSNTWVLFSPQATLSIDRFNHLNQQVLTHFLSPVPNANSSPAPGCTLSTEMGETDCPTWQSSIDSSVVWAGKVSSINAGTDASCPNTGSIPCLLLSAVATKRGQLDPGVLEKTTFIQRLNTSGGTAPAASCKVGDQALVPYSADYSFYKSEHEDSSSQGH